MGWFLVFLSLYICGLGGFIDEGAIAIGLIYPVDRMNSLVNSLSVMMLETIRL